MLAVGAIDFVELYDGVVGAPRPDTHVVVLRALAGVGHDVVFDDRAVGRDVDDAVAADVVEHVVANHDAQARIPLRAHPMGRPAEDSAAIDVCDVIAFDAQVDKAARLGVSDRAVVNAAVDFLFLGAVHVVNGEVLDVDVMQIADVLRDHVHAAADRRIIAPIGDLQVANFPVFLVLEQNRVLGEAGAVDHRERIATVLVNDDGMLGRTGPLGQS